ncbi:proline-rich protein HaeIII subfamily 1-like [Moschus berezovskii]|uniref:proline-rich protein HaeIII subfamily 1-like n=1 Tax=Moschus berezovskii TaxID=68408 RepID=UPI002444F1CB|nr:proline-rich protein HaeIII subfamily 1-like [Moschus berezovskii]
MNTDPSLPGQGFRSRGASAISVPSQQCSLRGSRPRDDQQPGRGAGAGDPVEFKGLPPPHPIAHVSSQRSLCKGAPERGPQVPGGACRGVASAALADPRLPRPRWVDGARLCAGSCCSKPPAPEGRLQLREPRGAEAAPGPGQTTAQSLPLQQLAEIWNPFPSPFPESQLKGVLSATQGPPSPSTPLPRGLRGCSLSVDASPSPSLCIPVYTGLTPAPGQPPLSPALLSQAS